jgi:hypothetical protein
MTLTVWQRPEADNRVRVIDVFATHGGMQVKITEDIAHLRHFWGELGHALNNAEQSAAMDGDDL